MTGSELQTNQSKDGLSGGRNAFLNDSTSCFLKPTSPTKCTHFFQKDEGQRDGSCQIAREVVSRFMLRDSSVFVYGLMESRSVLEKTNELLAKLEERCGPLIGAFRFCATPPPGLQRPVYISHVFLVIFETPSSAAKALQLTAERVSGTLITIKPSSFARPPSEGAEEACLRTFLPTSAREGGEVSKFAPSSRLWTALFSTASVYRVDWAGACAAAKRHDAIILDESQVALAIRQGSTAGAVHDGKNESNRFSQGSSPERRQHVLRGGLTDTRGATTLSLCPLTPLPVASSEGFASTSSFPLQQKHHNQGYSNDRLSVFSDQTCGTISKMLQWGWGTLTGGISAREEAPLLLTQLSTRSFQPTPQIGGGIIRNSESQAKEPAVRRRQLERGAKADTYITTHALAKCNTTSDRFTVDQDLPRLNALGSALSWVPGFKYLLPLFSVDAREEGLLREPSYSVSGTVHDNPFCLSSQRPDSGAPGMERSCAASTNCLTAAEPFHSEPSELQRRIDKRARLPTDLSAPRQYLRHDIATLKGPSNTFLDQKFSHRDQEDGVQGTLSSALSQSVPAPCYENSSLATEPTEASFLSAQKPVPTARKAFKDPVVGPTSRNTRSSEARIRGLHPSQQSKEDDPRDTSFVSLHLSNIARATSLPEKRISFSLPLSNSLVDSAFLDTSV